MPAQKKRSSGAGPRLTREALVKAAGPVIFDRADEYVCSEALAKRLVSENVLSAQVYGSAGIYHVRLEVSQRGKPMATCTCPAEMLFCKHAVAVGRTWLEEPETFFDLKTLMAELEGRSKEALIDLIREMAEAYPAALGVLGVEGFEEEPFEEW
ncbi:MAG: hypothetical protein A3F84_20600 [Candidatus Handelsmanbacteria bacterium RIFCSPLOWO2_12_FULL_64_10]|uniref:SWIM-type domain-containing protein n=1 Tax=Handelsmanbacteria sp. (strain RIFCSPLOWO2_12_FULL_64_10) TaxID=1817868 RepID=A0A1F6CA61_HANXR|nr:MAG: hypothetical protein A3F84_20600 [Candidatus Handelsmanbacteria bacterium RIFCSPLOWO2_12_FULL_64_10]